ncbi:Chaperone protein DnaJ [Choanephora cucurbitarum]|uniref:Chaperone protein DnaJ n=1 Tax=Choanephora cucurbitarum TaxID=101091 RepID=A0A1C7NRE5_9FUNG|nr:Chaperone protein DnaJ [Choanephora cucurbitarum]
MSFRNPCRHIRIRHYSTIRQKTPFEVLSLKQSATTAEIKSRYKELAKELHPDKKSTGDLAKFQELVQAYELLADPAKRSYYLRSGYGWTRDVNVSSPPPGQRPPSYTNAHWADEYPPVHGTRYTNNATFMSLLAGVVLMITTANIFYFQSSHGALLSAADRHHFKSSHDLKRAREEARLFGNDRGVKRVIESRMRLFREKEQ